MSAPPPLSPSLQSNPQLDRWIRIATDGAVHVFTGKVELGQGLRSAIARIAAEELDVPLERIVVHTADTADGPVEFPTVGSMSVEHSGSAVRQAAAAARQLLLEAAASRLQTRIDRLEVRGGRVCVRGGAQGVDYAELHGGRPFEHTVTGEVPPKPAAQHRIVGRDAPRVDLLEKLRGGAFLHDLRLPGMLFGRVARPPNDRAVLEGVDLEAVRGLPGVVAVVRDGSFLGVVAEREEQAERACARMRDLCAWQVPEVFPGADRDVIEWLRAQPQERYPVVDGTAEATPVPPHADPPDAAVTLSARYARPFLMHAAIGPSAAVALFEDGHLTVWSHSQGVALLRLALAEVLELPREAIRVIHADGPGCYGHNGADDAALDAALLARATPGRPVMHQWTREDEHVFEPYGPAMSVELRGSLDAEGRLIDWSHETTSLTHLGRPMPGEGSQLLAAWHLEKAHHRPEVRARLGHEVGIHRNAWPAYAIPRVRVVKQLAKTRAVRTSSLRSLGAFTNVFAIESFLDELAEAAGVDPVELRLRHLDDPRARAVIEAAAERASWRSGGGEGRGQGFAYARYESYKTYAAAVVDVSVAPSGTIRLERAVIAADAGQVVDPSGLVNQLEGGFLQAASWTLREEVRFDARRVTSTDWESYPILGFADVPEIETVLLDRPEEPCLGAGEATQGPTPAAIANAVFHATGIRLRRTPFTPQRVREALAGVR